MDHSVDTVNRVIHLGELEIPYTATDFVNAESYDFDPGQLDGDKMPRAFVFHEADHIRAIVFDESYTYSLEDAYDKANNSGKLEDLEELGKDEEGDPEYALECMWVDARMFRWDPAIAQVIWDKAELKRNPPPSPQKQLAQSWTAIALALGAGGLLVWIVNLSWVLEAIAGLLLVANLAFAVLVGYVVYRAFREKNPHWVSLTVAIILGTAIGLTVFELLHSHQLIRDYQHYSNGGDDDT